MTATKTLIRFYDHTDEYSLQGKCYFIVLPGTWEDLSDYDFECILNCVTRMPWQRYSRYAVGTAEIDENELFWSEIMSYDMHEVNIEIERVKGIQRYKLPSYYYEW